MTAEQAAELRKQINKTAAEKRQRLQKAVDLCKRINNIIDLDVEVGGAD